MTVSTVAATVRVGVIGVGRIGRMHAELLTRRVPGTSVPASSTRTPRPRAASARSSA